MVKNSNLVLIRPRVAEITLKMQKFPIDSYSNENFISLFFRPPPPGPLTPKRGEDTSGTRVCPHAKFGVNRPAGCREIVDKKTNKKNKQKTYSKTNTSPFALTSEWRVKNTFTNFSVLNKSAGYTNQSCCYTAADNNTSMLML